jgi:8-oxo-dGTP pyrophosphatase MutT (NUDIX family)
VIDQGHPYPATCLTAAGCLIHEDKVLLVKHKKLGLWLNPGGHIDPGELPHEAAEREFYEETGVFVEAFWTNIDTLPGMPATQEVATQEVVTQKVVTENVVTQNVTTQEVATEKAVIQKEQHVHQERRDFFTPNPISSNLHWISEENYLKRMTRDGNNIDINTYRQAACEQHLCFLYLVRPLGTIAYQRNEQEVDDIGWFTQKKAFALSLKDNVRQELQLAFEMTKQLAFETTKQLVFETTKS